MITIKNENNKLIADSLCELLKSNGIPSVVRAPKTGEISHIVSGQSFYGYDICVNEEDFEKAKELLDSLEELPEEDFASEETEEDKLYREKVKQRMDLGNILKRIWVWMILIFIIVAYILNRI